MDKIKKLLIIGIIVVLGLLVVKNTVIKMAVSSGVKAVTGLKLKIRSMDVGIARTAVGIRDMKLYNPKGYPDKIMADVPEIYVDYRLGSILAGKPHLDEVRLNLKELVVVKNADGQLNLDSVKGIQDSPSKKSAKTSKEGGAPEFQIDVLELTVGRVVYKDYSGGGEPKIQEFNANLSERYEDISSPADISRIVLITALKKTPIARLANFDIGSLQDTVGSLKSVAQKDLGQLTKDLGATAGDTLKKLNPFGN